MPGKVRLIGIYFNWKYLQFFGRGTIPSQGSVWFNFILSHFLEAEDFYRFDLRAEHDPLLESGNGPAL
jgi:hypothetical protein